MPATDSNSKALMARSRWDLARQICEGASIFFLVLLIVLTLWYAVKLRPFGVQAARQTAAADSTAVVPGGGQSASASASVAPGSSPASVTAAASCSVVPPGPKRKTATPSCPTCCASPCCGVGPSADVSPALKLQIQVEVGLAQKKLEDKVEKMEAEKESVLDKLITLIGAYSAILALTAFITLRQAREDARDQLARSRAEIDEFEKKLWNELPEIQNLKDRLRDLFLSLNRLIPWESDWTLDATYSEIPELDRQQILISEATMGALQIFVAPQASEVRQTMAGLYRRLARFYFARYQAQRDQGDAERAEIYVSKSLDLQPGNSTAYALRGAFALGIVDLQGPNDVVGNQHLLEKAEANLSEALRRNVYEIGASYNLALTVYQLGRLDEAIRVSIDGIQTITTATPDALPNQAIRKYGGETYGNMACYLAKKADLATDVAEADRLRRNCVDEIKVGAEFLNKKEFAPAFRHLKDLVLKELKPAGDLSNIGRALKDEIETILAVREL